MSAIPEGAATVTAEATDLTKAIAGCAEQLEVAPHQVGYKIDMSHFRSSTGTSMAKNTVKVIGWVNPDAPEEAPAKPAKKAKRSDDSDNSGEERRERRGRGRNRREEKADEPEVELGETEAATFAGEWFTTLLGHMDLEGEIEVSGNEERVRINVTKLDKPGRLVGKRGSTLGAVRHLLAVTLLQKFETSFVIDVDIPDNREGRKEREDRGDRGDRRERRGRGRRERGGSKGTYPVEKLQALARRAADKALESGKKFTVNLELNSFDRRTIHMEIAEIEGVTTISKERDDGVKVVQVIPESAVIEESADA